MRKPSPRHSLQRARYPLLAETFIPGVLVIAVPLEPDLLQIILEPGRAHEIPDLTAQHRQLIGIEYFGPIVFLDQACKRRQGTVAISMGQRRYGMIHDFVVIAP